MSISSDVPSRPSPLLSRLLVALLLGLLMIPLRGGAAGGLSTSHLTDEAAAVALVETGGGAFRVTTEARIGRTGDWELGLRQHPSTHTGPTVVTRNFDAWPNGSPVDFTFSFDGGESVTMTLSSGSTTSTVASQHDVVGDFDELFIRTRAVNAGSSIVVDGLLLDGEPVGDASSSVNTGTDARDVLRIQGGDLRDGFTLTGTITMSWTGAKPTNSRLDAQIWAAHVIEEEEPPLDLPPDPATVAPPLDRTVVTDIATATAFLYTGADPIQTGVTAGAIEPYRVAVLRGRVATRDGDPLPGVRVSILGRPEFGSTLSRADGAYDLVVNGGGLLTVQYDRTGYLTAQRQIDPAWRDYSSLEDVVLIPPDTAVTVITAGAPDLQTARGSVVTDADGQRRATLLFPAGVTAQTVLPDGTGSPLPTLSVRATEFTVGPSGRAAMPGPLPPNVAYTYAAELSVDESGAAEVRFSQPVLFYLENFLGFPVGDPVPVGAYNRQEARWIGEDNGRVVALLGVDPQGLAELDVDGSGQPADADALAALGVTAAELRQLALLYTPGQSLWRVPVTHFTPWDCNWPYAPPEDAESPPPDESEGDDPNDPDDPDDSDDPDDHDDPSDPSDPNDPDDPRNRDDMEDEDRNDCEEGSIIECQNQVLRETVVLPDSSLALHYSSDRVPGRGASYFLKVRLSGATLPASVQRIELELTVAGQRIRRSFPPQPNQTFTYTWDGRDAYGRLLQGKHPVTIRKGWVYKAHYQKPGDFQRSWARFPADTYPTAVRDAGEITFWRTRQGTLDSLGQVLGGWDAREQGLGGWALSPHHVYDPSGRTVYYGSGGRQNARRIGPVILPSAGNGGYGYTGDGGRAAAAELSEPWGVAVAPDGTLYIADTRNHVIRKVSRSGIITTVAGNGEPCQADQSSEGSSFETPPCGDGGPATAARLLYPSGVAVGPDGTLYIADTENGCVRRVRSGIIRTIAGTCTGQSGNGQLRAPGTVRHLTALDEEDGDCEGCPAVGSLLDEPYDLEVAADGTLYIADSGNHRIRAIDPRGLIHTIAGQATADDGLGDGGPALAAVLEFPIGLALGPAGEIYVAEHWSHRVRRIGVDGLISTLAGTGEGGFSGDGGPAAAAQLDRPAGVAVGRNGSLYVTEWGNRRVRRIDPQGIIATLAGSGEQGSFGDTHKGYPAASPFLELAGVTAGPDGHLYVTDSRGSVVYRIATALAGFAEGETAISSPGGGEVYVFDSAGRHLRTVNPLTRATLYTFRYDARGLLSEIEGGDGLLHQVERNAAGDPLAILGPFGRRTPLTLGTNRYLSAVATAPGETRSFTYNSGGLLETQTDPRSNVYSYFYDALGRLLRDEDPAGGFKAFRRSQSFDDYGVTQTTAEGRTLFRGVERFRGGDLLRVTYDPRAGRSTRLSRTNGSEKVLSPDGMIVERVLGADPVWGLTTPVEKGRLVVTPGGLRSSTTIDRFADLSDPADPLSLTVRGTRVDINGRLFESEYDALTRRTSNTSAEGRRSYHLSDGLSRPVEIGVDGLASTHITYDTSGRPSLVTRGTGADQRTLTFSYRPDGRLGSVTDALSRSLVLDYDAAGRVSLQRMPDGRELGYTYDANGNLISVAPPSRPAHLFTHTPVDLQGSYSAPDAGSGPAVTTYIHNRDRQITTIQRPDGQTVSLGYDSVGRPKRVTFSEGEVVYDYHLTTGQPIGITAPGGVSVGYLWDGFLPTRTTWSGPVAGSVSRGYDSNFRISSWRVNGTDPVTLEYDRDDFLVRAGSLVLTRDPQNGLLRGTALGSLATAQSYNSFGEVTGFSATYAGAPLFSEDSTRDALGRILARAETVGGTTAHYVYTYDPAGRLTDVTRDGTLIVHYDYDANGNRTARTTPSGTVTSESDAQDRLLFSGDVTYTYTANGDRETKEQNGHTVHYHYDELGNLRSVILPDGITIEYVIDGLNRRIGKKVNDVLVQGLLYAGQLTPVAELDGSGNVVSRFVYGSKMNVPDYMIKGGVTYGIVSDHLGSPRLVVNVADGTVVQRMDFDEFGRVILDTNPGFQPFGFAGGLYDRQTGLVRFGARDYDPEVGRWTAKDPILFSGGSPNLYSYVQNDPINFVDPSGLQGLTAEQVTNIVFNETRSLNGPGIDQARINIAHAIINGYQQRGDRRPRTAPATANVPPTEQPIWDACEQAVLSAIDQKDFGIDPTNGAIYFNFRNNDSRDPFQNAPIQTQIGPLDNSYTRGGLNSSGVYANTYGGGN